MIAASDLWVAPPGGPAVIRGISLSVNDGEWLAITGPNGCGKSTLAMALSGLVAPARGSVMVDGAPLPATPAGRRAAAIASVLQEPASQILQPTVAEELAFTARNLGASDAEVRERNTLWADRLGLGPELERDPRLLSAGRQQLVLLGAALASRPRLLVVDEGGAHWDSDSRRRAIDWVRRETMGGMTVVWVTQEPTELRAADRTLTLEAPALPRDAGSLSPPSGERKQTGKEWAEASASAGPAGPEPSRGLGGVRLEVAPWDGAESRAVRVASRLTIECCAGRPQAVRGPNGSGKTVLLEAASGLHIVSQVRVEWHQTRCPAILAGQHAELEVFAETVGEEMTFASRARGVSRERALDEAASALSVLGYGRSMLARRVWELSAGERRLVQVLAATVTPAGLVVLDEPTAGLDHERRAALADWIRTRAASAPYLIASQDDDWLALIAAESVCSRRLCGVKASQSGKTD